MNKTNIQVTEEVTHTPGPWFQNPVCVIPGATHSGRDWQVLIAHIGTGAGVVGVAHGATAEEAEANARLIGTAPELLAALKDCLPILEAMDHDKEEDDEDMPLIAQVRAAIRKAEEK